MPPNRRQIITQEESLRCTGRTTALMLEALSRSVANPGREIVFRDHLSSNISNNNLVCVRRLRAMIGLLGLNIEVTINRSQINRSQINLINNYYPSWNREIVNNIINVYSDDSDDIQVETVQEIICPKKTKKSKKSKKAKVKEVKEVEEIKEVIINHAINGLEI